LLPAFSLAGKPPGPGNRRAGAASRVIEKAHRDREGYARRPNARDEFTVWDKVTAWPDG